MSDVCHFTETTILKTENGIVNEEAKNHSFEREGKNINFQKIKNLILSLTFMLVAVAGYSQNVTYKEDYLGNTVSVDNRGNTIETQKTNVYTSDIENFWAAFDKIQQTKNNSDKYKIINELYIKKASKGLKAFMEKRDYTDSVSINSIENLPKFWNSIRKQTLEIKSKNRHIKCLSTD